MTDARHPGGTVFTVVTRFASALATLPVWLSALLVIAGLPLLVAGFQAMVRRHFPVLRKRQHNDVAGFLLAVIGVIYAVSAGFILIDQHENRSEAKDTARSEAVSVMAVAQAGQVMGEQAQRRITERALAYERAVVASWPPGEGSTDVPARALERLVAEIAALRPVGQAQEAFVWESTRELMEVGTAHQSLHLEAREGYLDSMLWAAILISSAATLAFCLLFGLENARLHYLMVAGVAIVVAVNLFLMVQLSNPFRGDLSVQPDPHRHVIRELER
ncbi:MULTISPECIES: hypothetical protein [unclassified Spirillospora]|uniref:bestrophin-like domain n=1 Tax=unclassified Spirillospora TaxID=2642701 RepID=UPI0037232CA9